VYRIDSDLGIAIYRLSSVKGIGDAKLSAAINSSLNNGCVCIEELAEYASRTHKIELLRGPISEHETDTIERLASEGTQFYLYGTPEYPERIARRLLNSSPPVLYTIGNQSILNYESVGYCGSRDASSMALEFTTKSARDFSKSNWSIVSGYAKGVDTAAHYSALAAGGSTTIVLAEGIGRFSIKSDYSDVWNPNTTCILSQFSPRMTWSAGNAMKRNKTIVALSDLMIVAQAGDTGGSLAAGLDAIDIGVPVAMPKSVFETQQSKGMSKLLDLGAKFINDIAYSDINVDAIRKWINEQPKTQLF
jgi:DNA processing protein